MKRVSSWWAPDADTKSVTIIIQESSRIPRYLRHVPEDRRRTCVQAGGHVGIYPTILAEHFDNVLTFEPEPENWECLKANLDERVQHDRIKAIGMALSLEQDCGVMVRDANEVKNYGASYFSNSLKGAEKAHVTECVALDDVIGPMQDIGFIMLDIEGAEHKALMGAVATLARCKPILALEMKALGRRYGSSNEDLNQWLYGQGYSEIDRIGNDRVYRHRGL